MTNPCGSTDADYAVLATIRHDGIEEIAGCRDLAPGVIGLLLAELVARYCALNPATEADRIAVERSRS